MVAFKKALAISMRILTVLHFEFLMRQNLCNATWHSTSYIPITTLSCYRTGGPSKKTNMILMYRQLCYRTGGVDDI